MVKARATEQKCGIVGLWFVSRSRRDVGRGGIVVVSVFCAVRSTVLFSLTTAACHRDQPVVEADLLRSTHDR